jgi:hypothetical protein
MHFKKVEIRKRRKLGLGQICAFKNGLLILTFLAHFVTIFVLIPKNITYFRREKFYLSDGPFFEICWTQIPIFLKATYCTVG